jgi:hypothetical protein
LGLTNINPRFKYQIKAYSREDPTAGPIDVTALHTYGADTAGLDFTAGSATGPIWFDLPATSLNVNFNAAAYLANGSQGALLLHQHNATDGRAEIINVTGRALATRGAGAPPDLWTKPFRWNYFTIP